MKKIVLTGFAFMLFAISSQNAIAQEEFVYIDTKEKEIYSMWQA